MRAGKSRVRTFSTVACTLAGLVLATPASAAIDCFMKIDGIDGESVDGQHAKSIEVLAYAWALGSSAGLPDSALTLPPVANPRDKRVVPALLGGASSAKAMFHDFRFAAFQSLASPRLIQLAASGMRIRGATLNCRRPGDKVNDWLTVVLSDVGVSSFQTQLAGGEDRPIDQVGLSFGRVQYSVASQLPNGTRGPVVYNCWDLKRNTSC